MTSGERGTTTGCLSIGKTGSMAVAAAIRDAGVSGTVHLHFLGPRALEVKSRGQIEPMVELAMAVAGRISDPTHRFRFATSVRDPIARVVSNAFYVAARERAAKGVDIVRDHDALVAWWEGTAMWRNNFFDLWFDDTYRATFGLDFRDHPFDHERKSLRYDTDRLRVVVMRQGDPRAPREAEIGWLIGRENVRLPTVNDAVSQKYAEVYRPFLQSFRAPDAWFDRMYETDVMRHFYTEAERAALRARWGAKD